MEAPRMNLKDKLKPPMLDFEALNVWNTPLLQRKYNSWYSKHIDPLFANAMEVGVRASGVGWFAASHSTSDDDITHRALLIGIEPIERGVTKEEIVKELRGFARTNETGWGVWNKLAHFADRIEREGIK
jgi:hypothetical protein